MQIIKHDVSKLYQNGVLDNTPLSRLMVADNDWNEYFEWQIKHGKSNNIYGLSDSFVKDIAYYSELVYGLLYDFVTIFLREYAKGNTALLKTYMGVDIPEQFIRYTIHTLDRGDFAIYGRFDIAVDWQNEKINGFYEFNSDTPSVLFESVYLQDAIVNDFNTVNNTDYGQFNEWLELTKAYLATVIPAGSKVACLCELDCVEDVTTVETITNVFPSNCDVRITDSRLLEVDHASYVETGVLTVGSDQFEPDYVYIMKPWEEMFDPDQPFMQQLDRFKDKVIFFEPAWRYFLGNKGLMVALTDFFMGKLEIPDVYDPDELYERIKEGFDNSALLYTHFTLPTVGAYVGKPIGGRLSSDIKGYWNGTVRESTDAKFSYGEPVYVYQELASSRVDADTSAILCSWMAPYINDDDDPHLMACAGIIIREFSNPGFINDIDNERLVGHAIID
jgi:glutathionylspermidine synthase